MKPIKELLKISKKFFTDIPLDTRRDILKANIDMLVTPYLGEETLTNHFFSSFQYY